MKTRAATTAIAAPIRGLTLLQRPVLQRSCDCGQHTGGGECEECKKKKKGSLQRSAANGNTSSIAPPIAPPIVHEVLSSPGQPLDSGTQAQMEPHFRQDFSLVRVHTDARAAASVRAVGAHAYTVGRHLVFGSGRYAPQTGHGRSLLSHELMHAVQQSFTSDVAGELRVGEAHGTHEREAEKAESLPFSETAVRGTAIGPRLQGKWDWERAGWGSLIGAGVGGAGLATFAALGAPGVGVAMLAGGLVGGFLIGGLTGGEPKEEKGENDQSKGPSINDPVFRKRWEAGLQKGLAHLKEVQPHGCEFPAGKEYKYDTENWTEIATAEDRKFRAHRYKPKNSVPFQAVDSLYKHLDRWTCDCRMFGEIAQLFAWFETLRDEPELFNKRFEGLLLSAESTTGLDRTVIGAELGSNVDDAAWNSAPVGAKVVWKNESPYAKPPWGYEHAIKSAKGTEGSPDLYAAQGIGFDVTEATVKATVAKQCVPDFPYTWTVTDNTIAQFKNNNLAQDKLAKLESIKGKPVKYLTKFVQEPALAEANEGRIKIPFPDEGTSATTKFFLMLFRFAERKDPLPDDKDVKQYILDNIHRNKVEIPK